MKKRGILRVVLWTCLIATAALIFSFSAQPQQQSHGISSGVVKKLLDIFYGYENTSAVQIEILHNVVRKAAHFLIYMILGFLLCSLLASYRWGGKKRIAFSLLFGLIYAASDELHQLFVQGRGAQFRDVMIDFCGIAAGVAAFILIERLVLLYKSKNRDINKVY